MISELRGKQEPFMSVLIQINYYCFIEMKRKVKISLSFQEKGKVHKPHRDWEVQYRLSPLKELQKRNRRGRIDTYFEGIWKFCLYSVQLRGTCQRILKFQPALLTLQYHAYLHSCFGVLCQSDLPFNSFTSIITEILGINPNSTFFRKAFSIYAANYT